MTDLRALEPLAPIADGVVVPYYLGDRKLRIALARIDGRLYSFDDLCTCGGDPCPLSSGLLVGHTIMCQCHGSRFDATSGAVLNGPASRPLSSYEVHELDGNLTIGL